VSDGFIERGSPRTPNWQPACLKGPFFLGALALILLHSAMCAALIVLKYTENKVFTFAASNTRAFLFWQFVPMIVAVIPGLIWEGIYNEFCRLQPYRDLASP
jgi:hypothetical protein